MKDIGLVPDKLLRDVVTGIWDNKPMSKKSSNSHLVSITHNRRIFGWYLYKTVSNLE
jgi:hypothetical protein